MATANSTAWYASRMHQFTSGREEVSNGNYTLLVVLMLGLAIGNACMNGFYGSEQATSWGKVILVTSLFFIGDLVLITLAHYLFPRAWTNAFAIIALVGFAVLSMFSATAFLVGQQHEQDNPQIALIDSQIVDIRAERDALPSDWLTRKRNYTSQINDLEAERREYINQAKKEGGFMTGASAIYHWLAKVTGFSVEAVSLFVRSLWSFVFVVGSMALGGMLNTMYSPKQIERYSRHLTDRTRTEQNGLQNFHEQTVPDNVLTFTNDLYQHTDGTVQASDGELYQRIKAMIKNGEIKPSVRALKPVTGSTDVAAQYLRDLTNEGVLNKYPNGYKLAV